jgi:hypothetical protein
VHWLYEQIFHFNVMAVILTVAAATLLSRINTQKELKSLSEEIYKNAEEIKDEIRQNSR